MDGIRALLVEDDRLCQKLAMTVLGGAGFAVDCARTGTEALAKARAGHYDVILLDLGLPDIHGLQVAAQLRRDAPTSRTPIIAVTAEAMRGNSADVPGCDGYIAKPIDARAFARRVADVMAAVREVGQ